MSIKIYRVADYEYTHEREQFQALSKLLIDEFTNKNNDCILIANPCFDNREIDAVFIKNDAICVLEFKNYGGNLIAAENGDWTSDNQIVRGGTNNKNPFSQVRINKTGLFRILDTWFSRPNVKLAHISGIVVFNNPINITVSTITPQVQTWFHITDMNNIVQKLKNITSRDINYTNQDLDDLIVTLNLTNCEYYPNNKVENAISHEEIVNAEIVLPENLDDIKERIQQLDFNIVRHFPIHEREGLTKGINILQLSNPTREFLNKKVQGNIWEHQYEAIEKYLDGKNVCLSTSTSSGKSLVFYSAGIELLAKDENAKIIAVYPLKALGVQQENNWRNAVEMSGLQNVNVGKIDGNTDDNSRTKIIKTCKIIIVTPDIIHAYFLGRLNDARNNINKSIISFLSNLKLIIIDEIHTYTGVFGSNSAYLFRRLNHAIDRLQNRLPQFITASATINEPEVHLQKIVGSEFEIITNDTSPKNATDILLLQPNNETHIFNILKLLNYFIVETDKKVITFLDSRKMVEQLGANLNAELTDFLNENNLQDPVIIYRAGYEPEFINDLNQKLLNATFRAIIATSTLEMGIDISQLNVCILYGIPYSATSLYQRIGRVGRVGGGKSLVIIVNDGSVRSTSVFKDPKRLQEIPLSDSALYLENENLQDNHALCFVEDCQEYDAVEPQNPFVTNIYFPESFIQKCINIRNHEYTTGYINRRNEIVEGLRPQLIYPLRNIEHQYKVMLRRQGQDQLIGNLTQGQVLREAYPGAIYRHNGQAYRVSDVDNRDKKVIIRTTNLTAYDSTKPLQYKAVYPQLSAERPFFALAYGELKVIECQLIVSENVTGFRNSHGHIFNYPITEPVNYRKSIFKREFITTGV